MIRTLLFAMMTIVLLGGTVAAISWGHRAERDELARIESVRNAIGRIEREIRVRSATGQVEVNGRGWPETIDPAWFENEPPINVLVPADRPWMEIAAQEDRTLSHPATRQSVSDQLATFWYNPAIGKVRARIGPSVSDRKALELYNMINGAALHSLFDSDADRMAATMSNPRYEELLTRDPVPLDPASRLGVVIRRHDAEDDD